MIIQSVHILTPNLDNTKKFYQEIIGAKISSEFSEHISFVFGHSVLTFHETKTSYPFYHIAFSIPNNKLEEALSWVEQRTELLPYSPGNIIADFSGWNARAFYFHDAQQNILEFITHYDLHTSTAYPFSASSISGISEIGITVDDVQTTCKHLFADHHIRYFVKGPLLKDFAVMGDANGMFIVSQTGRGWLPTLRPSEPHWTKVVVDNEGIQTEFEFE